MGPCDNVVLHRPNENGTEGLSASNALCSTEQEEARALAVPCPSCVNRLDFPFKLSTLFVCPANCRRRWRQRETVVDVDTQERKRERERREREESREIN